VALASENRELLGKLATTHQKLKMLKARSTQWEAKVQHKEQQVGANN
jgi:hypothetical protein